MSSGRKPVLYVTYDGLAEPLGASQVLPYVSGLRALGHGIELLSFEKPHDIAERDRIAALDARLRAEGIPWTRLPYHKRPSLPATAWDVMAGRRFVSAWSRAVREGGSCGLVHARGYLPGFMGLAGKGSGARLLFDMRGFWVDERIEGGYWADGSMPVRLGRRLERRLLRDSDHLVVLTRKAVGRLPDLAGQPELLPWTLVPTCVDLERFTPPDDVGDVRRRLGLPSEGMVLIHIGTLTGWYDGKATMDVAQSFLAETGGVFVVLTRDTAEAESLVRAHGVEAHVASATPAEVPLWLQAADAGLAMVRDSPSKDASFPTKVGEYLAAGLAVLGTPVGDMDLLADGRVLELLRAGDEAETAASWLVRAAGDPQRAALSRGLAESHLGLAAGVEALDGVYRGFGLQPERTT